MASKNPGKKILKLTVITLGVLSVLLIGFHVWFKAYAKGMIEDLVESTSKGKVKLKIGKFHFDYFSKKIELENAVFYNTDTIDGSTAYRFNVERINLQAKAILPIIFKKKILIDSLTMFRPHIEVTKLRAIEKSGKEEKKDVSIPEEMGKVYSSIQDALKILKVKRFQIEDGTFTLANKIIPNQLPMQITNLHFQIDNLLVDSTDIKGKDKILFSDNVVFTSHNQDILFPDGRHKLSFSHFKIDLQKKLVEFDSCTIAATRKDSSNASFNVFFDALFLTNIDFDTLYKSEVIKADSVYCINPKFNLEVDASRKKGNNKPPPKLENIIQQLTGDLQLKYVIVTNADFNIKTVKDGVPSTFTFSKNNFEMQGLSIDQEATKPIKVKSFVMAIRNYENFIKDSSYSIRFDSILFKDDRITLSNFIFNKLENGRIQNSFSIPQFNLQGLSWDELVFERRLKADQAIMFNPHISYTAPPNRARQKEQNIFVSLGAVNEYMDLQFLDIRDGRIDLRLKDHVRVQLENANVEVQSNSLLTSTKISGIKNSLTNLNFTKGRIQAGDMVIELNDIRYAGANGKFAAGNMHVRNAVKKMDISLQDVSVDRMLVDEVSGSVFANGVNWKKGDVWINSPGTGNEKNTDASIIELKNVRGTNTSVHAVTNGKTISTKLDKIFFDELVKKTGSKLVLTGLDISGNQLQVKDQQLNLSVGEYAIKDNSSSSFRQVAFSNRTGKTETDITIPSLYLIPHVQSLLDGAIAFDAVDINKPVVRILMAAGKKNDIETVASFPAVDISGITMKQPSIFFNQVSDSGVLSLNWYGERNASNFLKAGELHTTSSGSFPGHYRVNGLQFHLTDFVFTNPAGKTFNTGNGKIAAQVASIRLQQEKDQELEWDVQISGVDAKDFRLDSMGKTKSMLVMKSGTIENLNLNSSTITNLRHLTAANGSFRLKDFTGDYTDREKSLHWYNAAFNRKNNVLSADSFSMTPALERDSFQARQAFQTDYITVKTGAVSLGPVDLDTYIKDNKLQVGALSIDKFFFTDYKDRQLPFNSRVIKPLPVALLKRIPLQLSLDTVLFTNAHIIYTETGEKTKLPGTIPVTRMNAQVYNLKNFNVQPADSLHIIATGYLMDTAWIGLMVKESYADSLSGFVMSAQFKPIDLTVLNPVLIPLASAKINSGFLDTLSMRAIGREYFSWGEMEMFYHDLKVQLLKDGEEKKRGFLTGLVNLLVRNKNSSRTGTIFYVRKRDRSAINYLVKIVLSGITSSVGVKSNKKMLRRYKKEIGQLELPGPNK